MRLTEEQVARVRAIVDQADLSIQALKDDLVDHLCSATESKITRAGDFERALMEAVNEIAPRGLKAIENETIFLLNNNKVIAMKKLTYSIGLVASVTVSLGFLFSVLRYPGATELHVSGALGLLLLFFPLLAIIRYRDVVARVMSERLKYIFGFSSAGLGGVSVVFKMHHLQGADVLLITAFTVFIAGFLPMLFFTMYRKSVE